jgi:hypothetical protein
MTSPSIHAIVEVLGPSAVTALVETTNKIAVVAAHELGLSDLTPDEIVQIESTRLAVLADLPVDYDRAVNELRAIPSVAARLKAREDAQRVARGHEDAIANLRPSERMTYARQHGLTHSQTEKMVVADHVKVLSTLTGKAKLDYARAHGLA